MNNSILSNDTIIWNVLLYSRTLNKSEAFFKNLEDFFVKHMSISEVAEVLPKTLILTHTYFSTNEMSGLWTFQSFISLLHHDCAQLQNAWIKKMKMVMYHSVLHITSHELGSRNNNRHIKNSNTYVHNHMILNSLVYRYQANNNWLGSVYCLNTSTTSMQVANPISNVLVYCLPYILELPCQKLENIWGTSGRFV